MKPRAGVSITCVSLLAALGCSGRSHGTFHEHPGSGATGGSGALSGAGGSGAAGGSGGASASGGTGGASAGGSAGDGSAGSAGEGNGGTSGGSSGGSGGVSRAGGAGMSGAGAAGSAGTPASAGTPGVDISGTWSMFWWEDPVTVSIQQNGSTLTGNGCCSGVNPPVIDCCGALTGTVTGDEATFSFEAGDFATYDASVHISDDVERLGGTFLGSMKTAWVRPSLGVDWLPPNPGLAQELGAERSGRYELRLSSARAGRFDPLEPYELVLEVSPNMVLMRGALGPFQSGEMTFDGVTQTLSVGPVPATDPDFAVELELEFSGDDLKRVIATYADDGAPYFFTVTRVETP